MEEKGRAMRGLFLYVLPGKSAFLANFKRFLTLFGEF